MRFEGICTEITTYDVPRLLACVHVSEHLLQLIPREVFGPFERFHDLFLNIGLVRLLLFRIPPTARFKEQTEARDRVIDALPIFDLLPRPVGKGIV